MIFLNRFALLIACSVLVSSCTGDGEGLFRIVSEKPGTNCQYGGIKIQYGLDINDDGKLSDSEVIASETTYACSVLVEGKTSKINIRSLSAGQGGCSQGGYEITSGLDKNSNNVLDTNEIESKAVICNGTNGTNGTNGQDGLNSLVRLSAIPSVENPGVNQCKWGGTKIDSGLDLNNDGSLQDAEVKTTSVACSVAVIQNVIVETQMITPGVAPCG